MEVKRSQKLTIGHAGLIAFAVAVYSMSSCFTKTASEFYFLSIHYIACLCGVVAVLGIYAVLWQIILKRVSLSQAYPFRSLGVVYGLVIAGFVFGEEVTIMNIFGGALVLVGLLLMTIEK